MDFSVFDSPEALALNKARMDHLESIGLAVQGKSVLEVGCGVGNLSGWWLKRKCSVFAVDARSSNLTEALKRNPELSGCTCNMEIDLESLIWGLVGGVYRIKGQPKVAYDIVFCYGLLYHLENPLKALRNMAAACSQLLLIETIVCDSAAPILLLHPEDSSNVNQGVTELSTVPSIPFLTKALWTLGFYLYLPKNPPDHPDFQWSRCNDLSIAHPPYNHRAVVIGSRTRLDLPTLIGW